MPMSALVALAVLLAAPDRGDRFLELEREAFVHLEKNEWNEAIALLERQIAVYADNPRPYYNIACAYSLKGETQRALTWLDMAAQRGFLDVAHLDADTDLDNVRKEVGFLRIRERMRTAPRVLPTAVLPSSTAPAGAAATIRAEAYLAELQLEIDERLMEEEQVRAVLFAHYDKQMARNGRYVIEHRDARDADDAARERVRIASLYLARADGDEPLRKVAAGLVHRTTHEFLALFPGSPHREEIRLWNAHAHEDRDALPLLTRLTQDAEGTDTGARALAELIVRQPREMRYRRFVERYASTPLGAELLRERLWRQRLQFDGLPEIEFDRPVKDPGKGKLIVAVVIAGQEESLQGVKRHEADRMVLVVLGGTWPEDDPRPRAKDPVAAARALGVPTAPLFLVFEDGRLSLD